MLNGMEKGAQAGSLVRPTWAVSTKDREAYPHYGHDFNSLYAENDGDGVIELDTVRAASDGVVEIYAFNTGEIGDLLGSEMVSGGANANVRVGLGGTPVTDVIALLKVDGQVVDMQEIDLR